MKILTNFNLTNYNSYKIKAFCKRAFFPANENDFLEIFGKYQDELPKIILGGGNNIIFSKNYYNQDFIIIGKNFSKLNLVDEDKICAQAGVHTIDLCEFALANELSGVEVFYDIPSSIGGAIVMNAGASGEEIKDVLINVSYLDLEDLLIKKISNEDIGFHYRNSFFQKNSDKIVLNCWLQLHKAYSSEIKHKMEEIKMARWMKQPRDFPNAGSVFKRPKGFFVGALVEELNLKGFKIGGAKISEKHGGFIINEKEASGEDIINIIREVQKRVHDRHKIELEIEQRII